MSRNFRFQRVQLFDAALPTWHTTHKRTEMYVGEVRNIQAGNYEARRPSDATFNGDHPSRVRAARWLKDKHSDPAIFDEREEDDEASED